MIRKMILASVVVTGVVSATSASPAEAQGFVHWGPHGVTTGHVGPYGAGVHHWGYGYGYHGIRYWGPGYSPYGAAAGLAVGTAVGVAAARSTAPVYYPPPVYYYPAPVYYVPYYWAVR